MGSVTVGPPGELAELLQQRLGEIAVVASDLDRHRVPIDDPRLFLAPPERAHHQPYIVLHQDAIIAVPTRVREPLIAFLRGELAATVPA